MKLLHCFYTLCFLTLSCFGTQITINQINDPLLVVVIMVKDEGTVIKKTLLPYVQAGVNAIVVFDTGSTDDTIEQAQSLFDEYNITQGHIVQEPFVDFATSRNRALDCAEELFPNAGFMLMPDAEWYFHNVESLLQYCEQEKDNFWNRVYLVRIVSPHLDFYQQRLIRCRSRARFAGVVHEYVDAPAHEKVFGNAYFELAPARQGIEKTHRRWHRDLVLLQNEHEKNPTEPRTAFYLAQTHDCLGNLQEAYHFYQLRTQLPGWDEETFMAQYRLAQVAESMVDAGLLEWPVALDHYLKAFSMRPWRIEPLVRLARHYLDRDEHGLSYLFANRAIEIAYPDDDTLFVDKHLYEFDRYDIVGRSAWYLREYPQGEDAVKKAIQAHPEYEYLYNNLRFYLERKKNLEEQK